MPKAEGRPEFDSRLRRKFLPLSRPAPRPQATAHIHQIGALPSRSPPPQTIADYLRKFGLCPSPPIPGTPAAAAAEAEEAAAEAEYLRRRANAGRRSPHPQLDRRPPFPPPAPPPTTRRPPARTAP